MRTLVCVSTDDKGHAYEVMTLTQEVNDMIDETLHYIDDTCASFPWPAANDPLRTDHRWASVNILLKEPWFERGWVVQETRLSKDTHLLWGWGATQISWDALLRTCLWGVLFRANHDKARPYSISSLHFPLASTNSPVSRLYQPLGVGSGIGSVFFLDVLSRGSHLYMSDERDRVYAFLGLASCPAVEIEPDYTRTFLEVYHDFACKYVSAARDIRLLNYISHSESTLSEDFPSWVPRWNILDQSLPAPEHGDSMTSASELTFTPVLLSKTELQVRGVIVDTVCETIEIEKQDGQGLQTYCDTKGAWEQLSHRDERTVYPPWQRLLAFLTTLTCGNTLPIGYEPWVAYQKEQEQYIQHLFQPNSTPKPQVERDEFHKRICQTVANNRMVFIVTSRGYWGLASQPVKKGDYCCILFGETGPCILRDAETPKRYKMVGQAHITGKEMFTVCGYETMTTLGQCESKEWTQWGLEEQDIVLC